LGLWLGRDAAVNSIPRSAFVFCGGKCFCVHSLASYPGSFPLTGTRERAWVRGYVQPVYGYWCAHSMLTFTQVSMQRHQRVQENWSKAHLEIILFSIWDHPKTNWPPTDGRSNPL